MGFIKDFKSFLMKGDIVALATAVIIGGAFNKIVSSLVADVIMPLVGLILQGQHVSNLFVPLDGSNPDTIAAAKEANAAILTYGNFIQAIIDFIIVGFVIFIFLKGYEKTKKKKEEAPVAPAGPSETELLTEIRDLLKKQQS
ncbi:large-conductance mechanosensitive channel protein MscL [Aquimarina sp. U1-2]|uniref:large-conductance mechanosensitive channel protein MscL n=1 Tax=Aquimarina sp. U1-2 TaxID=2823141 RepID=UPI001AECD653|nr:large-conductance mechanosensitive channel protein MscL [Aquimarina sp. U1-2]MBP2831199.1 large-conductance mechanosensitive channel protein MscL [Aquimarina sp. U1-2]